MTKRGKFIQIFILFLLSMMIVTCIWVKLIVSMPDLAEPLKEAEISKMEIVLSFYGIDISKEKIMLFSSIIKDKSVLKESSGSEKIESFIKYISIPSGILTAVIFGVYSRIVNDMRQKKMVKDKIKKDKILKERYFSKYIIGQNSLNLTCLEGTTYDEKMSGKKLIIWLDHDGINMINSDFTNDIGKYVIKFENVLYFSRYGDFYTTMNIEGGDSSFSSAFLGYLIAGDVGAIVASRKPVTSDTIVNDNRETLLVIKENDKEKYLFFEPKLYEVLMRNIPNKEMNNIMKTMVGNKNIKNDKYDKYDKYDKLVKLGDMRDKGYISDEEFNNLKTELISK